MAPLLAHGRSDRAFERMYRKHVHDVYRYALGMLRNPADAEDVTQTTFMNAYRAFERGERPRQPQNWLITIAHNVCRQRFRNASRRPAESEWDDALAAPAPDEDEGPSIADVQRALAHLPFNQRSALVMRELEGRSYAEIAEILELTVSAVETLLFRARRALREQLEGALTCGEAERSISRQIDDTLPREERGRLRAHLRECKECARHARRLRAQRAALKGLGAVPLPTSLVSWFGGGSAAAAGGAAAGVGIAAKAAAVVAASALVAGAGHEVVAARGEASSAPEPAPAQLAPRSERAAGPMRALPLGIDLATPVRARAHGDGPPAHAPAYGVEKRSKTEPKEKTSRGQRPTSVVAALVGREDERAAAAREKRAKARAGGTDAAGLRKRDAGVTGRARARATPKAARGRADAPREHGDAPTAGSRAPAKPKPEHPKNAEQPQPEQPPAKGADEKPGDVPSAAEPVIEEATETVAKVTEKVPPVPPAPVQVPQTQPPPAPKVKIP